MMSDRPDEATTPTPASSAASAEGGEPDRRLGEVLGGLYRIERCIGEGGMGRVYEAEHIHLGKRFAIKVLAAEADATPSSVERLRQEAIAASRIESEHIVDVVSLDATSEGEYFIVMELLEGQSLAALLRGGRLPLRRSVTIVRQIAAAVGAAHARAIVHRDLKPENIFVVSKNGGDFVKVLDFGISKMHTPEREGGALTTTGELLGTPLYLSPEQARGDESIGSRADLYAIGAILYECLTGTPLFSGVNAYQLLWKHTNELPERPTLRAPEAAIPDALEAIVLRALSKNPAERQTDLAELASELQPFEGIEDVGRSVTDGSIAGAAGDERKQRARRLTISSRRRAVVALLFGVAAIAAMALLYDRASKGGRNEDAAGTKRAADDAAFTEPPRLAATPKQDDAAGAGALPFDSADPDETSDWPLAAGCCSISIRSEPAGALIELEGEKLGHAPLTTDIPLQTLPAVLRLTLAGYVPATAPVAASPDQAIVVRLKPLRSTEGRLPIKRTF